MKKKMTILAMLPILVLGIIGQATAGPDRTEPVPCLSGVLIKLDLSREQKQRMAVILEAERPALSAAVERLMQGRADLKAALSLPNPDPASVRKAHAALSAASEDLLLGLAAALPKLRAVMTPQQQEMLAWNRDRLFEATTERVAMAREILVEWIQQNK